jgi:hypothetical protein
MMDHYQVLGCSPGDDISLIKKKYQGGLKGGTVPQDGG